MKEEKHEKRGRLLKIIKSGNATIEVYESDISDEERKQNLISLYKTINEIAENKRREGKNVDDWFYTKEELEEMKKSGKYRFL